jgi:hypothetical protein
MAQTSTERSNWHFASLHFLINLNLPRARAFSQRPTVVVALLFSQEGKTRNVTLKLQKVRGRKGRTALKG